MAFDPTGTGTRTVSYEEAFTDLSDAIADVLLTCNGDVEQLFTEILPEAFSSCLKHYNAERVGEADGVLMQIVPENGTVFALADHPAPEIPDTAISLQIVT